MDQRAKEIGATLTYHLNDCNTNTPLDDVLLGEALELVETYLDGDPSAADPDDYFSILLSLVSLGYKCDTLNECTLKAWRLFSRAVSVHNVAVGVPTILEFGSLLCRYCEEGLSALAANITMVANDVESYLQHELTTIKLLGFFTLRLTDVLSFYFNQLVPEFVTETLTILLHYAGILHIIGRYTAAAAPLILKSHQNFDRLAANYASSIFARLLQCMSSVDTIDATATNDQYHVTIGATHVSLHMMQLVAAQEGANANASAMCGCIFLFSAATAAVSVTHCGVLGDAEVLDNIHHAVQIISGILSELQNASEVLAVVDFMTTLSCGDECSGNIHSGEQPALCFIARQLLCGVLASFGAADPSASVDASGHAQSCLADVVWQHCKRRLTCNSGLVQVYRTVRAALLAVDANTCDQLLLDVFSFTEVRSVKDGRDSPGAAQYLPAVQEGLLAHLPIAHMISTGSEETVRLLRNAIANSVDVVARCGGSGSASLLGNRNQAHCMTVGSAISILVAAAGYHSSARGTADALQQDTWRACLESATGNVGVGTTLLRWISSLSEHIRTLLSPAADGGTGDLNAARVQRVSALAAVLTALVRCLWSHSVPRAVQQLLAKAARNCCEAATHILSAPTHQQPQSVLDELSDTAVRLIKFAAATMKVVVSPNFSEKSIEAVKLVYESWAAACKAAQQSNAPQQWRYWTLFLASLQQFANALPALLKPRARELVAADLVPLIQSRALGRTYSLLHRADVVLTEKDSGAVTHRVLQQHGGVGTAEHLESLLQQTSRSNENLTPGAEFSPDGDEARARKRPRSSAEPSSASVPSPFDGCNLSAGDLTTLLRRTNGERGGMLPILQVQPDEVDGAPNTAAVLVLNEKQLSYLSSDSSDRTNAYVSVHLLAVGGITVRVQENEVTVEGKGGDQEESFSYTADSESGGGNNGDSHTTFTLIFDTATEPGLTPT